MQLDWIPKVCLYRYIQYYHLLTSVLSIAGESGDISYGSCWRDHEIMYHVAPLMPTRQYDIQQVHRKRYIGNGI